MRSTGACSLSHGETLSLQTAYGDHQIGSLESFDQPVEDPLVVLRQGPKVFLKYELRLVDRLKSQLLIGHLFTPLNKCAAVQGNEKSSRF